MNVTESRDLCWLSEKRAETFPSLKSHKGLGATRDGVASGSPSGLSGEGTCSGKILRQKACLGARRACLQSRTTQAQRRNLGQGRDLQPPAAAMAAQCPVAAAPPKTPRCALQARALVGNTWCFSSHVEPWTGGDTASLCPWPPAPGPVESPRARLAGTDVAPASHQQPGETLTAPSPGVHRALGCTAPGKTWRICRGEVSLPGAGAQGM